MLVPLYLASLPASQAAVATIIEIRTQIYVDGGTLAIATEGVALWALLAISGYLQWFMLLPWLVRLTQRALQRLLNPSRLQR